jgi:hypothetical protein
MTSVCVSSSPYPHLRRNPHLYEINAMAWLNHLSHKEGKKITFADVPREEWSTLKDLGIDLVWLMGVWERSPASRQICRGIPDLVEEARSILEDFEILDLVGSPYAIHRYTPDPALGTPGELLALKKTLEREGLLLILDFVPNHTATDHPWIDERPEYYVHLRKTRGGICEEGSFPAVNSPQGSVCIAHGKDPYFPPWTDTAQLDYSEPLAVQAILKTIAEIAPFCHGLRCDMAMLLLQRIFKQTWHSYLRNGTDVPEFWPLATDLLKAGGKQSIFLGEAYWGTEGELFRQGFDFVYDKTLYDRMAEGDVPGLKRHLSSPVWLQERMTRFLENHDEPRAMERFGREKIRSAMVAHATLPGLRFWHQGQWEGRCKKIPVQMRRAPRETPDEDLFSFSKSLLHEVNHPVFHDGQWGLCDTSGWPDNQSHQNLLAWCWDLGEERRLIIVNFCSSSCQGYVRLPQDWFHGGGEYSCYDPLKGEIFRGSASEVKNLGLYVGLNKWDFHFFHVNRDCG